MFPKVHPVSSRHARRLTACALVALGVLAHGPADAALVNDYTSTDDVWNAPVAGGHWLVDARVAYVLGAGTLAPTASLVYGLGHAAELGLWSSYAWSSGAAGGPQVLNPYLKVQLPGKLGNTTFGMVAGSQLATMPGQPHVMALEGVASWAISESLVVDGGLGAGVDLGLGASPLGHANAAVYWTPSAWPTLIAEVYTTASAGGGASYGQHLAVSQAFSPAFTLDLGVAANEVTGTASPVFVPMLGATYGF